MSRTWAQYSHMTYPLHDRIPGLGRFKIQIPRRETNFTDEVLNNNPPVTLEGKEKGGLKAKRSWLVRVESRRYASNFCKAAQTS